MAKKQLDPLKAKQKKQKILAGVLGVLFLGLLAFQVPRLMKQMNPEPTPSVSGGTATTAAPPAGTPTLAAPTLRGAQQGAPATTPTGAGTLVSATATVQDGQLASFSRFASKDPFAQQLSDEKTSSPSSGGGGSSGSGSDPGVEEGIPDIPGTEPTPGSAVISVNGTLYTVPLDTDFPQPTASDPTAVPLFHLVALTAHTAKISIVGGSYTNGARTVALRENKAVTLMNTADGTRYTIILKPAGTQVPTSTSTSGGSGTPTTITLPPATP